MTEFAKAFEEAYRGKFSEFVRKAKLRRTLRELEDQGALLRECIEHHKYTQGMYPIILGNSLQRISITNIGRFPPYSHTPTTIIPVGFTSKKKYKPHAHYSRSTKDKILYVCSVTEDGPCIKAEDGFVWSGTGMWESFSLDTDSSQEYSSFAEFAGLTRPPIIKLIEKLGDISRLAGYVPYDQRSKDH